MSTAPRPSTRSRLGAELSLENGTRWTTILTQAPDDVPEYDVIIVGSGMGGGILADDTSDAGLRTLVLEAGPLRHLVNITDLPLNNSLESLELYDQAPGTDLQGGYCYNLGGRSIYWSAVIPRMRDWELSFWPDQIAAAIGNGYPLAEQTLRKRSRHPQFQDKLRRLLETRFGDYDVEHLPRSLHQPGSPSNPRPGSPDERSTGVFSAAALLADSLRYRGPAGADNLVVATEHVVERVILDKRKAVGVEVHDLRANRLRTFKGKKIVLAAGTIESARLALVSGIDNPLVGRGLSDHPEAAIQFVIPDANELRGDGRLPAIFGDDDQGNILLRPKRVGHRVPSFSCELALNWKFWDVRVQDDDIWRQRFVDGLEHPQVINSTIKFLFHNPLPAENSLTFQDGRLVVSLAEPNVGRKLMRKAQRLADEVLNYFGSTLTSTERRLTVTPYWLTHHLAGSLRMSESADQGVVDLDLKFHGYENLYCSDLSVFPDIPASNPSLTLTTLTHRLARHLKATA